MVQLISQDGMTLAVADNRAIIVGRAPDGKDMVSEVDLTTPAMPKLTASISVVEAASAVSIQDHIAIVVGRGIEILNLV